MLTTSNCDCSRSLSTNPIARSTSRGTERNVRRRLACSLVLAAFGALVGPETLFAQVDTSSIRTSGEDFENLVENPRTSGIWSDDDIMWIADSNVSNEEGRVA